MVTTETQELPNNVARTLDKTVSDEEEVRLKKILGVYPRFIRILTDQNADLQFKMPKNNWQDWEEGLTANTALELTDEGWGKIRIIPSQATRIRLYFSGRK